MQLICHHRYLSDIYDVIYCAILLKIVHYERYLREIFFHILF